MSTANPLKTVPPTGMPAGFFSRLEAWIIDLILITIVSLAAIGGAELIIRFFIRPFMQVNFNLLRYSPEIVSGVIVFYYLFFWSLLGFTPGKFLLGLKIVRPDGRKIGLGRAIVRFIGYWISIIALGLGFIWIIIDPKRQAWHDKLAGTHVIYTWEKKQ